MVRTPGVAGEPSSALVPASAALTDMRVRNDVAYRYVVTLADAAGNSASRELIAVPGPRLLAPARRALVSAPPVLRWTPVRGARYYNVQLFRNGRQILSAWPKRPELRLRERWRFGGRRIPLTSAALPVVRVAGRRSTGRSQVRRADRRPQLRGRPARGDVTPPRDRPARCR